MYIIASSSISHQPTYRNKGFSSVIPPLEKSSVIVHPDYSNIIPVMERRRMSDVLKMAIACTVDCLEQSGVKQPEAIIVGTSMGCNTFTKNFLDKIISSEGGLISPTSFMLSTHNTIAGQISLLLGNTNYNMTHTQNTLSFEQALLDGILCFNDGCSQVLAGASDETENVLFNIHARLQIPNIHATCGASFFMLSNEKPGIPTASLVAVESLGLIDDLSVNLTAFLYSNELTTADIDIVLYSCRNPKNMEVLNAMFTRSIVFDFEKISGCYFTNSAFAMHYATDILSGANHPLFGEQIRRVLICNNLIPENLGLILVENKQISNETQG